MQREPDQEMQHHVVYTIQFLNIGTSPACYFCPRLNSCAACCDDVNDLLSAQANRQLRFTPHEDLLVLFEWWTQTLQYIPHVKSVE